jgi:hypothetical protein
MAKKQTEKVEVNEPYVEETIVLEAPKTEPRSIAKELPKKNSWDIKDRVYVLRNNRKPLSYSIKSANVYYFDEEKGHERELKYCENQRTAFVDEMQGEQRLAHIIFRNGNLFVPKEKTVLQKLLSLYHPMRGRLFEEVNEVVKAVDEISVLEMEIEALNAAISLDIDMAEAVMRVEIGSKVTEMSSKELKRDLLLYAKRNPQLFLDLVNDDNVMLRNFGIKS